MMEARFSLGCFIKYSARTQNFSATRKSVSRQTVIGWLEDSKASGLFSKQSAKTRLLEI
jgi:hypothetical protein